MIRFSEMVKNMESMNPQEREKYLKGMLEYCYQNKESFKTMIARIEKELAEYGSSRKESYTN